MDHGLIDRGGEPPAVVPAYGLEGPAARSLADEAVTLSALWSELVSGACKVEDSVISAETFSVVVRRGLPGRERRTELTPRDIEIVERSLLEGARKAVAVDHCLCSSSIAETLRRCFVFMGFSCWPSRMPLLLVMAAHAKHAEVSPFPARLVVSQNQRLSRQCISASRPDLELARELSPAEYGVTRLLVEGKSYTQIAELRQTSRRTVANQLAAAFRRLDISGRTELLCLLAKRQVAHWQAEGRRHGSRPPLLLAAEHGAPSQARAAG